MDKSLLSVRGLVKSFGPVRVLKGIDFDINAGEVCGLLGANGAGKSTLIKILSGYHMPTAAQDVTVRGEKASWPLSPSAHRIAVVHQDQALVPDMTVLENVMVPRFGSRSLVRPIDWGAARREVNNLLEEMGLRVGCDTRVSELTPAQRALVALARGFVHVRDASDGGASSDVILILDEPTATLGRDDSGDVLSQVRSMAARGAGVVFVTHRLEEVRAVADRLTILRDGRVVYDGEAREEAVDVESVMFGDVGLRTASAAAPSASLPRAQPGAELAVRSIDGRPLDPPIVVEAGEVVGITGLRGDVHERLAYRMIGARLPRVNVELAGRERAFTPSSAAREGVVLVSGNRLTEALWGAGTVLENISVVRRTPRKLVLGKKKERVWADAAIRHSGVQPPDLDRAISTFSGGNQQKISMARWLTAESLRVLLVHEPTQGIDLQARRQILSRLRTLAHDQGMPVLVFTTDYEAISEVADRTLVVRHSQVVSELPAGATEDEIEAAVIFQKSGSAGHPGAQPEDREVG